MDLSSLTLPGLVAIGMVNVLGMFFPNLDSRIKFAASAVAAFIVLFIPADFSSMLMEKVTQALTVAFAASGTYKIATKVGGN